LNDFSQAKTEKNIFIEIIINSIEKRSLDKVGFTDSPSLTPIFVDVNAPIRISNTIGMLIIPTCPKSSSLLLKSGSCAGISINRIVPTIAPAVIEILEYVETRFNGILSIVKNKGIITAPPPIPVIPEIIPAFILEKNA